MMLASKFSLLLSFQAFLLSKSFTPSFNVQRKKALFVASGGFGTREVKIDNREKNVKSLEEWAKVVGIQ